MPKMCVNISRNTVEGLSSLGYTRRKTDNFQRKGWPGVLAKPMVELTTVYGMSLGLVTISPQFMQRTYDIILSSIWCTCLQLRYFICII